MMTIMMIWYRYSLYCVACAVNLNLYLFYFILFQEERRHKKEEEEGSRRDARAAKMAEFEKWKNPSKPNFIITKKDHTGGGPEPDDDAVSLGGLTLVK